MTIIAIFAAAVLADLWTTDRALRRHPNAVESHPIVSRLFGGRPSRGQFAAYAAVQAGAWIGAVHWLQAPVELLLI
ncbi:MAG: hypothetical protein ACLFSC_13135, partial [Wenzhouxiangella sp.]